VGEDGSPEAHGDEGLHGVVVVAAEDHAWLETGDAAAMEDDARVGATQRAADPGLLVELVQGD
jgi:hypothetical protein